MNVGTADAGDGEVAHGWIDVTSHPTGGDERLPVVVVEGASNGPTVWVTGGVHGDESTGVAAAQDAARVASEAVGDLRGTLVCVPVVNPAGLRRNERTSYYAGDDPNRYFPDPESESTRPPRTQERVGERLYEIIVDSADAVVDLHTAQVGSVPFAIRDRVLYGSVRDESAASDLAADLERVVDAFGLPSVTEYEADEYLEQSLQRSLAGAVLNSAGIPAFTAELGGHSVVEEDARDAAVAGVVGVLTELGLLDGRPDGVAPPGKTVPDAPVDYRTRRAVYPRVDTAGLVRHHVEPGDVVEAGDVVADVVTPHGERVETVESDHDGYVLSRREGLAVYEGDAVCSMAVRDEGDLVVPRDDGE